MLQIYKKVPSRISTIMVAFDAGARAESGKYPAGIAHMLEYMLFKGTENRSYLDIPREIAFLGGSANAYTSDEIVAYYINVPYENLEPAMDILSDMVFNSTFPEEEFLKEREVVLEEEASSNDDVESFAFSKFSEGFFTGRVAEPIIGSQESINGFTSNSLKRFYKDNYRSDRGVVSLVSCITKKKAKELMKRYFGRSRSKLKLSPNLVEPKYSDKKTEIVHRSNIEQSYVYMGYPGMRYGSEDEVPLKMLMMILGGGMDSRLFTEVREKHGLCYGIGSASLSFRDQGSLVIHSSTRFDNLEKMKELIRKEVLSLKDDYISDYEIEKTRNKYRSSTYSMLESSSAMARFGISKSFFSGLDIEDYDKQISEMTKEKLIEVANKYFNEDKEYTLVCTKGGE